MATTLRAVFDGEVLRPAQPADLEPNTVYLVTVEREVAKAERAHAYPLSEIRRIATDMGLTDLSSHHDRYAHGHSVSADSDGD